MSESRIPPAHTPDPESSPGASSTSSRGAKRSSAWPKAIVILGVTAMVLGTFLYVFNSFWRLPGRAVEEGKEMIRGMQKVAEAFFEGTITTSFTSYASEVEGTNYLQFATLRQTEVFRHQDQATALWGTMELPEVVVEATAPVEYTYFFDLDRRWDFTVEGQRVVVVPPPIDYNQPSVDVSALSYEVRSDSVLRDEEAALERLKAGLTHLSYRRAEENLPLVRESARQQVKHFVTGWLTERFSDGEDYEVVVILREEREDEGPLVAPGVEGR
ncbi:MAG: hypothetical protein SX243_17380 [Acidobacteriota bacterium]|nr:hypothetical protein [Acidobacteriota bacterium]